jgi:small subunit ribosomal protein S6
VVAIIAPTANDEALDQLAATLGTIVTTQGGTVTKTEKMGKRLLAYPIKKFKDGHYLLLEIEGTGREIAELERRMRVNDTVVRYITVRVDLDRRRAEKFKARRALKASKRPGAMPATVTE